MNVGEQWNDARTRKLVLNKALVAIVNAKKDGRLKWGDSGEVIYAYKNGIKTTRPLDNMPELFLDIIGTQAYVLMLVGDIKKELQEIFRTVLNTDMIDIDSMQEKINSELDELNKQAKEEKQELI